MDKSIKITLGAGVIGLFLSAGVLISIGQAREQLTQAIGKIDQLERKVDALQGMVLEKNWELEQVRRELDKHLESTRGSYAR